MHFHIQCLCCQIYITSKFTTRICAPFFCFFHLEIGVLTCQLCRLLSSTFTTHEPLGIMRFIRGGVPERPIGAVSKTVVVHPGHRGFESHPLRYNKTRLFAGFCILGKRNYVLYNSLAPSIFTSTYWMAGGQGIILVILLLIPFFKENLFDKG